MKKSLIARLLSSMLCLAMVLTGIAVVPSDVFADITEDVNTVRGTAYYKSNSQTEFTDEFYFSDDLFKKSSLDYDPSLATTSVNLAGASRMSLREPDTDEGYANKVRNLRSFLEDTGFVDFENNAEYEIYSPGDKGAATACAHKSITANGKPYTLLALVPRSGTFGGEFMYEFLLSEDENDTGDNYDFENRRDAILDYAAEYIQKHGIKGDIKVWITGYSRGAGIVNLVGAKLIDDPGCLGSGVTLLPEDLYCYTYGTPRAAGADKDYSADKYKYIHNIVDSNDLIPLIGPVYMGFYRYGSDHQVASPENRERMLSFLRDVSEEEYEDYLAADPMDYVPLKIDTKALLKGEMSFTEDEDPYLPVTIHDYNDSICRTVTDIAARSSKSGKNGREGYYREYQTPLMNFGEYLLGNIYTGKDNVISTLTSDKRLIPLAMTMYLTFMTDKYFNDGNAEINSHIEGSFNALAAFAEKEDGTLKKDLGSISVSYYSLRDLCFEKTDSDETVDGIPQKYALKYDVGAIVRSKTMKKRTVNLIKKMNAKLYSDILRDALSKNDFDQSAIDILTSEDDSEAMSYLIASAVLGSCYQSDELKPFSLNNEQFRNLATLAGNASRLMTEHDSIPCTSWLKAADTNYDDYTPLTDAQKAGYRRVYVSSTGDAKVSGCVKDESGNIAAVFENGRIVSRTNDWIGMTTCDSGNWLRLPVDQGYKVEITTNKSTAIGLKIADYSVEKGSVVRTVFADTNSNWKKIKAASPDKLVLDIPAVPVSDKGEYDITGAKYSLKITRGKTPVAVSSKLPAAKKVRLKAAKKAFTVSWTKFSSAKRAKIDKIEVQYSTKKSFSASKTVSKKLAKTRKSLKVKGLKKGKTYYARVRTIKYTDDATYVSKWSSVKKVKVK